MAMYRSVKRQRLHQRLRLAMGPILQRSRPLRPVRIYLSHRAQNSAIRHGPTRLRLAAIRMPNDNVHRLPARPHRRGLGLWPQGTRPRLCFVRATRHGRGPPRWRRQPPGPACFLLRISAPLRENTLASVEYLPFLALYRICGKPGKAGQLSPCRTSKSEALRSRSQSLLSLGVAWGNARAKRSSSGASQQRNHKETFSRPGQASAWWSLPDFSIGSRCTALCIFPKTYLKSCGSAVTESVPRRGPATTFKALVDAWQSLTLPERG